MNPNTDMEKQAETLPVAVMGNEVQDKASDGTMSAMEVSSSSPVAKSEGQLFKKLIFAFTVINIVTVVTMGGLAVTGIKMGTRKAVTDHGQLVVINNGSMEPVSTVGASGVAHVTVGDDLLGKQIEIDDEIQTYVGSISKDEVEWLWKERQAGVQEITVDVNYIGGSGTHSWMVTGNIDVYELPEGLTLYSNLESTVFPGMLFTVICYEQGDLCGIIQTCFSEDSCVEYNKDGSRKMRRLAEGGGSKDIKDQEGTARPPTPGSSLRRLTVTPDVWDELGVECWLANYELSLLFHQNHFFLAASPVTNKECPTLAVDADFIEDKDEPMKKLTIVESLPPTDRYNLKDSTISLATFAKAVNEARVMKHDNANYDLTANNCGTFILDVIRGTGIEMDDGAINYIVDVIVENETVMAVVRDTATESSYMNSFSLYFMGEKSAIKMIVTDYVNNN